MAVILCAASDVRRRRSITRRRRRQADFVEYGAWEHVIDGLLRAASSDVRRRRRANFEVYVALERDHNCRIVAPCKRYL